MVAQVSLLLYEFNFFSVSVKNCAEVWAGIALKPWIAFGRITFFTMLFLLNHKQGSYFSLPVPLSIFFSFRVLKLCKDFILLQVGYHQEINYIKCWRGCEGRGTYIYSCWECKLVVTMEITVEIS